VALKNALRKLTATAAELDKESLRDFCDRVVGTTRIAEAQPREEVTVVGEIKYLRIVPRPDGSPWLEATINDSTGSLVAMWTGRKSIAGVANGKRLMVTGRGAPVGPGGRLVIYNPKYELL
jgi:hypothetical protein